MTPSIHARSCADGFLAATLAPAVRALGGSDEDAELVRDLALARMNDAIAHRRTPTKREVKNLVAFCLAGVERRADAAEPGMAKRREQ